MSQYPSRRTLVPQLVGDHKAFLIVSGLAGSGKDIGELTRETPNTFLFGGAMGGAVMTGLGVALMQPSRRVLVVTGDGDLLMSLGALTVVAATKPSNFALLCVDNELYGETGNQPTNTASGTDLAAVAKACGFPLVHDVRGPTNMPAAARDLRVGTGPVFVLAKINGDPPPDYSRNWHAAECKTAFRTALLGHR